MAAPSVDSMPQTLSLPAILINPKSRSQHQVQAFAEQQKQRAQAQRAAAKAERNGDEHGMRRKGEGKRSLRRRENAVLIHNPYALAPTALDYLPPPPSHSRSFPSPSPRSIQSTSAPSPSLPTSDPTSSAAGAYTLSLKGVRQLLRKRGRRAELLVGIVEGELTAWLEGLEEEGMHGRRMGWGQPRIVDSTPTEGQEDVTSSSSASPLAPLTPVTVPTPTRSLPQAFTTTPTSSPAYLSSLLASFYSTSSTETTVKGKRKTTRPALVELMRSPGHLIWAVADGFERLVVHLLCRCYELISFSQTLPASTSSIGQTTPAYRITHVLLPQHLHPTPLPSMMPTPENTDLDTASSATETEHGGFSSSSEGETTESEGGMFESDSEREEVVFAGRDRERFRSDLGRRDRSVDSDWSDVAAETPSAWSREATPVPVSSLSASLGASPTPRRRRASHSASSADGEADSSDDESLPGMMDSLLLPSDAAPSAPDGWTSTLVSSSLPSRNGFHGAPIGEGLDSEFYLPVDLFPARRMREAGMGESKRRGKVSFFEYLYG